MSLVLLVLALCLSSIHAQTSKLFQWQFSNNFLSTNLPTCLSLGITIKLFDPTNDTSALFGPPFYMIAFEVGGTPRTTLLGTDQNNLSWTVDHPVGTNLMLSVVDTNGSAGGIPPQLYTVVTGQSTTCIPPPTASDFTVTANVTDIVTTCQPWGLRIKGGAPPYNVTLAALNSSVVTNVTILGIDDALTYIDRADPNTQLLAAVSDLTGRWASGTPIVHTQGSTNVTCTGLITTSGNATQLDQQEAAEAAAARKHKNSIIIGVCVTFGLLFLLAGCAAIVWYTRRRQALLEMSPKEQLDLSIKPFEETSPNSAGEGHVLSINSWINPSTPASPTKSVGVSGAQSLQYTSSVSSTLPNHENATDSRPGSSASSRPGFTNFPVRKVRNAKSLEAAGLQIDHSPSASISTPLNRAASAGSPLATSTWSGEEQGTMREYVIQHRDGGGAVVRELPPPYADRTGAREEASA